MIKTEAYVKQQQGLLAHISSCHVRPNVALVLGGKGGWNENGDVLSFQLVLVVPVMEGITTLPFQECPKLEEQQSRRPAGHAVN